MPKANAKKARPAKKPAARPKAAAKVPATDDRAFVSMLIHELRTPLTALRGSLGLLTGAVEDAAPEVQSFAGIADRNAEKLASMLDEAAEHSRLNDQALALNRERTDVADSVHRAVEQVQRLADERGIVLDIQAAPAEAVIDAALIGVAVARLVSYAIRVSPKAATIRIAVGIVEGGGAEISVSDCGKVIAAESVAQMFAPFSAVARRSPEPAMRTGLGLVVARRITQLHGGSLEFAPTEQGGVFTMRLRT